MKYLKIFSKESDYTEYVDSDSYIEPNVSYIVTTDSIYFNPITPIPVTILNYNSYYPEVGQRLQQIWNKYRVKWSMDSSIDSLYISYADDYGWTVECNSEYNPHNELVDSEDLAFLQSLQLTDRPTFQWASFDGSKVRLSFIKGSYYINDIEILYDGHTLEQPAMPS